MGLLLCLSSSKEYIGFWVTPEEKERKEERTGRVKRMVLGLEPQSVFLKVCCGILTSKSQEEGYAGEKGERTEAREGEERKREGVR